jgi:hypothetical protein
MTTTYSSRIDRWLLVALLLPLAPPLIVHFAAPVHSDVRLVTLATFGLYLAILGGLVFPMRYTVDASGIRIRFGLARMVIAWDQIDAIRPSSSPLSSPALSLRRLEISYRKPSGRPATVRISPVDREAFVRDCASASPKHRVDHDALVR